MAECHADCRWDFAFQVAVVAKNVLQMEAAVEGGELLVFPFNHNKRKKPIEREQTQPGER